jgi:hypothetical protein
MKYLIYYLWTFILFLEITPSYGQTLERQLISGFGQLSETSELSASATLGELSIQTARSSIFILTEGFQQPNPEDFVGVAKSSGPSMEIIVYPNPLFQIVRVRFNTTEDFPAYYNIWDSEGKTMKHLSSFQMNANTELQIDCSQWEGGQYFLSVFDENEILLQTLKIIKL